MNPVVEGVVEEGAEPEAVANARRRLEYQRQAVGGRHPEYATSLNQLALLLIMHGDPEGAEPLLRDSLEIRKETLGEAHPDYATSLSSLGGLLWARGDVDGAEPLLRRALEIRLDVLGEDHPKTVASLDSLEQLIRAQQDGGGDDSDLATEPILVTAVTSPDVVDIAPPAPPESPTVSRTPDPVVSSPKAEVIPQISAPSLVAEVPAPAAVVLPPVAEVAPPARETPASRMADEETAAPSGPDLDSLKGRLEVLSERFARLGKRLSREAESWKLGAVPPTEALIVELGASRREFTTLRDELRRLNEASGNVMPGLELDSLQDFGNFLHELGEVEARRTQLDAVRRQALAALDRVASLECPDQKEFPPLKTCQAKAEALRGAIAGASLADLPQEAVQLAEGDHPYVALVTLVESKDGLSDDLWASSMEAVEREFGKPLAVAVARARVVLPSS